MEVRIPDLFDLRKIADSGQCFRVASFPDGTYRFITGEQVLYIRKIAGETYRVNCDQDPWEMLVTFIISQRKSIPAIRSVVELLSERYGAKIQTPTETLYTFPTARQMENVCQEDYIACKAGYRAPYLCDAVRQVLSGSLDLERIASFPDEELIAALEGIKGVGIKVANCVALFAYGRTACAPVDTWIQKIIRQEYQGRNPFDRYGDAAGIMQQYFFYYAQNHKTETA